VTELDGAKPGKPPRDVFQDPTFDVERIPLATQVVDRLRQLVLSGRLPPGTKLIQEHVAAELRVSRTPLREAIRILVYEGLLTVNPSNGSVQVVEISDKEARELYEIREMIDGLAARLCASQHLSPEQLQELGDLAARMNDTFEPFDMNTFITTHSRFHITILRLAGNSRLQQFEPIVGMSAQMLFHRYPTRVDRMRQSAEEHFEIIKAIASQDGERAERVARAHIQAASAFWLPIDPANQPR
jgi:DNA-binding GntR family transcriptional regulator